MQYTYYITDVFTKKSFDGAQIAVFPHADGLDQATMQLFAGELNISETAFVFSPTNDLKQRRVRIFTPHSEIDFAGHPIIAVGYVLAATGDIPLEQKYTALILEQNIGEINVNITRGEARPELIQFEMKTKPVVDRFVPKEEQIAELLGLIEADIDNKKFNPLLIYSDQSYLIVPVKTYLAVRAAKFNFATWSRTVASTCMANEILLFSTQTDVSASNFHARLLGTNIGIYADPPVASAMPAFAAYLCAHEHIKQGTHTFIIDRGSIDKRKSVLNIEMDNKLESTLTIRVGGPAVITGEGTLFTPKSDAI